MAINAACRSESGIATGLLVWTADRKSVINGGFGDPKQSEGKIEKNVKLDEQLSAVQVELK